MKTQGIVKFWCRVFLLGIPLIICLVSIVVGDPFKVIYKYDFGNYYDDQPFELNRDYVSTQMLLSQSRQSPPDAFIFGSSRSFSYLCESWQKENQEARCFHYPAASENLYGIYAKIKLIDRLNLKISHALLIMDYHAFDLESRKDHLHILHPAETGDGWLNYETAYLEACFSKLFVLKYIDYKLAGRIHWYTRDIFQIEPGNVRIMPLTNDYVFAAEERQLAANEDAFYESRRLLFTSRKVEPHEASAVIGSAQLRHLSEIKAIFDKHKTDYRIIISPLYDQVSLNRSDLAQLEAIFGKEHVSNYSGTNEITVNMRNFYDPDHYRPFIAEAILRKAIPAR